MPTTPRSRFSRLGGYRTLALIFAVAALFGIAALVPLPTATQVRTWADSCGPLLPLVFFTLHALVCVTPFPRTVFTLSAGMLFGPVLGLSLTISASTVSAVLALLLVRALDKDRMRARLTHPTVRSIDERLARRGWLAVGSLRLIAFAPFAVVNYCAGLSSVRTTPYVVATVLGILPGTIGTVLLADALTTSASPTQILVSGACIAVGILGLVIDTRLATPGGARAAAPAPEPEPVAP
ncbi:TVP38/TMEM64 family protein [Nocardia uniformis]|uniref:TVP38/TMEM64 family membrane protein n=1 Tax=Nocardia uniformis TaxID=53432 RepID=A0A849BUK2_9NOCA|nr:TVP38/TMEM64 family protein [Nocardia uniformis]NNH68718.1 TVP38/TMEM64 family protein [Nocardia uniformis]